MNKVICILGASLVLAGCAYQPAPATQVAAVQPAQTVSAPTFKKYQCKTIYAESGKPERNLMPSVVTDFGNFFTVQNAMGEVVISSPLLTHSKGNQMYGMDEIDLVYRKGTGKFTGFYSRDAVLSNNQYISVIFNCKPH